MGLVSSNFAVLFIAPCSIFIILINRVYYLSNHYASLFKILKIKPSTREKSHGSNSRSQNTGKSPLTTSPSDPTPPERPTVLSIVVPPSSRDPPLKSKRLPPQLVPKPTCWDNTPLIAPRYHLFPTSTLPLMVGRGPSQEKIL